VTNGVVVCQLDELDEISIDRDFKGILMHSVDRIFHMNGSLDVSRHELLHCLSYIELSRNLIFMLIKDV